MSRKDFENAVALVMAASLGLAWGDPPDDEPAGAKKPAAGGRAASGKGRGKRNRRSSDRARKARRRA